MLHEPQWPCCRRDEVGVLRVPLAQVPVQFTHTRLLVPLPLEHAWDCRLLAAHVPVQVPHRRLREPFGDLVWYWPLVQVRHAVHDLLLRK